jgi:hypothetical protein
MTPNAPRRIAAALAISAFLLPSLAQARPVPREAGAAFRMPEPKILQWLWSSLAALKNGSQLDPDGAGGREENGPGLDPDGAAGQSENGPGLDPNGRT